MLHVASNILVHANALIRCILRDLLWGFRRPYQQMFACFVKDHQWHFHSCFVVCKDCIADALDPQTS